MSCSHTYAITALIMVVPPGELVSSFSKLFSPFDISVWYVLSYMMVIAICVSSIIKCSSINVQDFFFGSKIRTPYLNIASVIVGWPMNKLPNNNFARWILMMFIMFWLINRSIYQGILYKNLQSIIRQKPVQTIEESIEKNYKYLMLSATVENIKDIPQLMNNKEIVTHEESLDLMHKFNDPQLQMAFLGAIDTVRYLNKINYYNFSLNICPQSLLIRQHGIYFPKHSFLTKMFDEKLSFLLESGLLEHWMSKHVEKSNVQRCQERTKDPIKLSFDHLLSAFEILLFGLCLAAFTFTFEIISIYIKSLRKFFYFF